MPHPNWTELLTEAVTKPGLLLKAYTAFHNYSLGNQILAIHQCAERGIEPGALNTYPGWQRLGRQVKRGERALTLCMPTSFKAKDATDDDARRVGFMYKPRWFVLAQTEGEAVPPPAIPQWSKERAFAALDITEQPFDLLDGNTQGYARKRSIAINPLAAIPHKTMFHELAHVLLGHTQEADFNDTATTPRSLREVEAEAVALLCCEALELPGADYARGYIQNWRATGEPIPEQSAQKIFRAADQILKAGAPPAERKEDTND